MTHATQLAIIGAGPGGYTAAFLAADLGMAVTLIDDAPQPGGVCLYRGCMPSKALLHVAKGLTDAREAARWGVDFGQPQIDVDRLRAWKDQVVDRLTGGLGQLSKQRAVNYVQGLASIVDAQTLNVATASGATESVRFEHAILATGSRPARPAGLALNNERVLDSTSALAIEWVPRSLLVIGGGYIGLELGTVYATLGFRGYCRGDDLQPATRCRSGSGQRARAPVGRNHSGRARRYCGRRAGGCNGWCRGHLRGIRHQ